MPSHDHSHPHVHAPSRTHSRPLRASWLRGSALQRLAGAAAAIALLWAAVLWALR